MRKLLISAAVIALFTAPPVWAQPDHDRGHGGGPQGEGHGQEHGGGPHGGPQGGGPAPQQHGGPPGGGHSEHGGGPPAQSGPNPAFSRGPNGGGESGRPTMATNPNYSRGPNGGGESGRPTVATNPNYSRGPNGGGFNRPAPVPDTAYSRGPNGGGYYRPPQGAPGMASRPGGEYNRGYGGGPRHDFRNFGDYHQDFVAPRHFRAGVYRPPAGWYPHRWVFGEFLPTAFWARDYWLINFMDFGLPPPPYGAIWVRVGYDALLIDQDTGEIITVEYGVFY